MTEKTVRMSFSLPESIRDDLNYLSKRTGVSKSALLADLMREPIHDLRGLVEAVPPRPTEEDLLRARGRSQDLIEERLQRYREAQKDLF